jgi:hypothetical protein
MTAFFAPARPASSPRRGARLALLAACLALPLAAGGCSNLSDTQQRTLSGGAIGAGAGAVGTAITGGCVACGAALGGAVGAGAGYLSGRVDWDGDGRTGD